MDTMEELIRKCKNEIAIEQGFANWGELLAKELDWRILYMHSECAYRLVIKNIQEEFIIKDSMIKTLNNRVQELLAMNKSLNHKLFNQ